MISPYFRILLDGHVQFLEEFLRVIEAAGLKLKQSKYAFAMTKVTFSGHEVSEAGLAPNSQKTVAIAA